VSNLRPIATSAFTGVGTVVQPGQYSLFTGTAAIPAPLAACAYPTPGNFYGVLAAASNSSQNPPTIGGIRPMAGEPVISVNVIRFDPGHHGRHDPHANVDRSLWFKGESGQAYRLSFDEHPVHFRKLSADTGLDVVLTNLGVPLRPSGPLSDLSSAGGWQNFSTSFPKRGS
jgi:hypothetical protein